MPASSRSDRAAPAWRFNITAAEAARSSPRKTPFSASTTCTRAERTPVMRLTVRASSPSVARRRFTFWVNSDTPKSPLSKSSKPMPPLRGSPSAAGTASALPPASRRWGMPCAFSRVTISAESSGERLVYAYW
jgi:hypothetical protein